MRQFLLFLISSPFLFAIKSNRAGTKAKPAKRRQISSTKNRRTLVRKPPSPSSKRNLEGPADQEKAEEKIVETAPPPKPPAPSAAPGLFSPRAGETAESITPSFRWFYVGGATHYELVWSLDTHFHKAHILLTNQTAAILPPEQALEPGSKYFWRVRGGNEGGWGPWSVTQFFKAPEQ